MKSIKIELKLVQNYVQTLFKENDRPDLLYHNFQHTKSVATKSKKIADKYKLSDEELYIVVTAAWFHDLGFYLNNKSENHEVEGVKWAMEYFKQRDFEPQILRGVENCILATKMPQAPSTFLEKIICDADLFHLGTDNFMVGNQMLRLEKEMLNHTVIDDLKWNTNTLTLMKMHEYHTPYCQKLLNKSKAENIKILKNTLEKIQTAVNNNGVATINETEKTPTTASVNDEKNEHGFEKVILLDIESKKDKTKKDKDKAKDHPDEPTVYHSPFATLPEATTTGIMSDKSVEEPTVVNTILNHTPPSVSAEETILKSDVIENPQKLSDSLIHDEHLFFRQKRKKKEEKKQKGKTSRGVETVFRVTSGNNQKMSGQADSKAHIMITVNSIIISVLLSVLLRRAEDDPRLIIPILLLLLVNVSTIIFSVLATRPNIPTGMFNDSDVQTKKVNLLFFGNFYKMNLESYAKGMFLMMEDRDFLYGSLIQDVYNQGLVLAKKYRLLRISYNIFMYGLILSVIAFVIASLSAPSSSVIH